MHFLHDLNVVLRDFPQGGMGSIPSRETKITHAVQPGWKQNVVLIFLPFAFRPPFVSFICVKWVVLVSFIQTSSGLVIELGVGFRIILSLQLVVILLTEMRKQ